jgi:hypothetical protein
MSAFGRECSSWVRHAPWIVLLDLDSAPCAPDLVARLLPGPAPQMRLRVAVRAIEAWILGDQERFSTFFSVARSRLPSDPDSVDNPKQAVVSIARHSRLRAIRADVVPEEGSGRSVGLIRGRRRLVRKDTNRSRLRP